ncbi:MAG: hypothetical protein GWM92_18055 [Gemmatimonadetes bacterium]|nr:hypothetical protein [Gemmatimonadota bacterium]NIR80696.1 hypothetical protein [Gemmatimonadota bacterium]NIT89500.1 hypothetical protein [Gemmatimonadota bacterium]NIU33292.1 hypothetical protein [Gemmatimonadota bacterium]NIU37586.1 hypothetical protein [Gemmatimonadota bacterium]
MSPPSPPPADDPLRVDGILELLPRTPELHPILDLLVAASHPDPDRRWAGSGELGTVGDRIVRSREVARGAAELAEVEAGRIADLFRRVAELVEALASKREEQAVSILLEQGGTDEASDRPGDAEAWYRAAHALARKIGNPLAPEALRRAARAARSGGRLGEAARDYEEAWREAGLVDRREDRIVAAIGRGNVAVDRGRWDEAERWYGRARELADGDRSLRRERWQILQNLAIVHRRRGELGAAREALETAENEARDLDDPDAVVEVGNGWGQLLLADGNARGAELYFRRALEAARSPRARVTVAVNLGEALLAQGRALEAGEAAREAEAEALARGVTGKLPEVYRLLAAVARKRGEGEAFVLLERALRLIEDHDLPAFEEGLTLEAYGGLRLERGDREAGISALERAARIYVDLGMDERGAEVGRRAEEARSGPGADDSPGASTETPPDEDEERSR